MWRYEIWSRKSRKGKQSPKKTGNRKENARFFHRLFWKFLHNSTAVLGKKACLFHNFSNSFSGENFFAFRRKIFSTAFQPFFKVLVPKRSPEKRPVFPLKTLLFHRIHTLYYCYLCFYIIILSFRKIWSPAGRECLFLFALNTLEKSVLQTVSALQKKNPEKTKVRQDSY